MKDFPKFIGIAMALALALCLIGCANSTGSEVQSQPEAQTEVTFTTAPIDANCPFVGYWSDELPGVSPATLYLTLSVDGTWTYTSSDTTDMFGEWTWDGVDTAALVWKNSLTMEDPPYKAFLKTNIYTDHNGNITESIVLYFMGNKLRKQTDASEPDTSGGQIS